MEINRFDLDFIHSVIPVLWKETFIGISTIMVHYYIYHRNKTYIYKAIILNENSNFICNNNIFHTFLFSWSSQLRNLYTL